jgi:hypothetical protein
MDAAVSIFKDPESVFVLLSVSMFRQNTDGQDFEKHQNVPSYIVNLTQQSIFKVARDYTNCGDRSTLG